MLIAGIDMGIENTKAVIMKDGGIIGRSIVSTGGIDRPEQARRVYDEALNAAGIDAGDIKNVTATGKGKYDIPFASGVVSETIAASRAARFYFPEASGVMSVGADETIAVTLGDERLIREYALNQKCAAGIGTFLKYLAMRLELTETQAGNCDGPDAGAINEGCVVFSELDALSLLNNGAPGEAIMSSAIKAAAARAATVYNDLTIPPAGRVVIMGGLAKNRAFAGALEKYLTFEFLNCENPEYCGAVGAALSGVKD
ncbi:MAG: acyl-CoA dehydratase activase [Acidobacteriota bacterium]|jgi:benzoyl-CoA reductase subunit D|nr:acyl-CoA dehydratase activase [Acidobacteriota bacterium]